MKSFHFFWLLLLNILVIQGYGQSLGTPGKTLEVRGGLKANQYIMVPDTSYALACNDTMKIAIVNGKLFNSYKDSITGCAKWQRTGGDPAYIVYPGLTEPYITTSGDTTFPNITQWVRDSIRVSGDNLIVFGDTIPSGGTIKVIIRGLTGYKAIRFSNDSSFIYNIRDSTGTGIVISQAPDSALVIRSTAWLPGGNSYGADTSIGTNDNFAQIFETNGQPRGRATREGQLQWGRATASDSLPYRFQLFGRQRIVHDTITTDGIFKIHSSVGTLNNTQTWANFVRTDGAATWGLRITGTVDASNGSGSSRRIGIEPFSATWLDLGTSTGTVTSKGAFTVENGLLNVNSQGINATNELRLTSTTVLNPRGTVGITYGRDVNPALHQWRFDGSGSLEIGGNYATNYSGKNWGLVLDIKSTNNKAVGLPTLTTSQAANIVGPKEFQIDGTMTGYDNTSTVSFSGGGGTGLAANLVTSGGRITNIVVTNWGSGYTSAPTATLSGPGSGGSITVRMGFLRAGVTYFNTTEGAQFTYDGSRWQAFRYNGTKFQGWDGSAWVDLN